MDDALHLHDHRPDGPGSRGQPISDQLALLSGEYAAAVRAAQDAPRHHTEHSLSLAEQVCWPS